MSVIIHLWLISVIERKQEEEPFRNF